MQIERFFLFRVCCCLQEKITCKFGCGSELQSTTVVPCSTLRTTVTGIPLGHAQVTEEAIFFHVSKIHSRVQHPQTGMWSTCSSGAALVMAIRHSNHNVKAERTAVVCIRFGSPWSFPVEKASIALSYPRRNPAVAKPLLLTPLRLHVHAPLAPKCIHSFPQHATESGFPASGRDGGRHRARNAAWHHIWERRHRSRTQTATIRASNTSRTSRGFNSTASPVTDVVGYAIGIERGTVVCSWVSRSSFSHTTATGGVVRDAAVAHGHGVPRRICGKSLGSSGRRYQHRLGDVRRGGS